MGIEKSLSSFVAMHVAVEFPLRKDTTGYYRTNFGIPLELSHNIS